MVLYNRIVKIKNDTESFQEIKKSRFITYLHRCSSEEEAKDFLKLVRKTHPDAAHHCYAYRIGSIERSNDDGEPSGTAGHPMLNVLKNRNVDEVLAVIVRYFGGTLLGTGGLTRAYSSGVSKALEDAVFVEDQLLDVYSMEAAPEWIGKAESFFRTQPIEIIQADYDEKANYRFTCPFDPNEKLAALSQGKLSARKTGTVKQEVEIKETS